MTSTRSLPHDERDCFGLACYLGLKSSGAYDTAGRSLRLPVVLLDP
jgi:hypothetical protein